MPHLDLSEQQRRSLELVNRGMTSKEIAIVLKVSPGVVDNYIAAAVTKMGASGRREAARMWADRSNPMVQSLHLQPGTIAPSHSPDDEQPQVEQMRPPGAKQMGILHYLFGLPSIGGRTNDLSTADRLLAIARICFVAALLMIAVAVIVQGAIQLLT